MSQVSARLSHLSPEQLHQLQRKLRRLRSQEPARTSERITRRPRGAGPFPLSYAQRRLWLFEKMWPGTATYNVPASVRLGGRLDVPALKRALAAVIERHEVLRTRISLSGAEPVQEVLAWLPIEIPRIDLSSLGGQREAEASRWVAAEASLPFDVDHGPLVRVWLIRLGPQEHVLLLNMHHLVCDNWSQSVFFRDLTAFHRAFQEGGRPPLGELAIQYVDYAAWQRDWLSGQRLESELEYWRGALRGAAAVLDLPLDRPRPPKQSFRGEIVTRRIAKPALRDLGDQERATTFMMLLAGFKAALHVFSGLSDIVVGSPVSGRERSGTEELIGFFSNTLVLRSDLSGNPSLREVVRREREVALGAFAHQNVPFDKLLEDLRIERDPSHPPLFQVNFLLEQTLDGGAIEQPGLSMTHTEHQHKTAKFDVNVFLAEQADALRMHVLYSRDIFEEATIQRLTQIYEACLEAMAQEPDGKLEALAAKLNPAGSRRPGDSRKQLKATNLKKLGRLRRRPAASV